MRKYTSVGALALRLTWKPVLLTFVAVGLIQWFWGYNISGSLGAAFEMGIAGAVTSVGMLGILGLMAVLILAGVHLRGSRFPDTLCRLRIPPRTVGFLFAAVFSGYFFLYWMFQLAMVLVFYTRYAQAVNPSVNHLLVAAYRSEYFHLLLPLRDGLGYWRNLAICLNFGFTAALCQRHRGGFGMLAASLFAMLFLPMQLGNMITDIVLVAALTCLTAACGWMLWKEVGWREN